MAANNSNPPDQSLPRQFGDYELIAEIGRGGFGIIFKARQCCLDRLCAVKMLHAQDATADAALTAEAQAAASLDHPHIVGIYEVGREEGRLFFSMEFVEGQNLAGLTRSQVISATRVATYSRKIAEAIHYAHSRGVLHCDLKPANVLIDPADEPQITDFGLARKTGLAPEAGREAEGAGSPNFMAPEQCDAQFGEVSPQTDVFGLGAILYYLLTDRPPFRGETFKDTLRAVTQFDPVRPRALRPGVPLDLETICLRCLEKRPGKRYRNAKEVADELGRFLNDEPIHARAINPVERLWRRARRHPWLAGFAAATVTLLGIVAVGSTLAALRIESARQEAESGRRAVTLAQKRTAQNLYAADVTLAFEAWQSGNSRRVREILERQRPAPGATDFRGWEWAFLQAQARPDFLAELPQPSGDIRQIAVLDDGRTVLVADTANHLRLWSLPDRRLVRELLVRAGGSVRFAVSADGSQVAVTDRPAREADTTVRILALPALTTNASYTLPGMAAVLAFDATGNSLWARQGESLCLHSLPTGRELRRIQGSDSPVLGNFAFSPDTRRVAIADEGGNLTLRETGDGRVLARTVAHERRAPWEHIAYSVRFSPDGKLLASGGPDGTVALWHGETLAPAGRLSGHQDLVSALAFSPDSRLLVSAGRDPELFVWNLADRKLVAQPRGNSDIVFGLEFLPDGSQFLSGGNDRSVRRWQLEVQPRWNLQPRAPAGSMVALLLPGGRHYLTAESRAGLVQLFRLGDGREIARMMGQTNILGDDLWVSPEDHLFGARYLPGGRVEVGRLQPPGDLFELSETNWVQYESRLGAAVAFSPDGRKLAVCDPSNGLRVWDLEQRRRLSDFPEVIAPRVVQFSPDGSRLVALTSSGEAYAANVSGGGVVRFAETVSLAQTVAFSPDQRRCAIPGFDGGVLVFELATGKRLSRLTGRSGALLSATFSPDGTRLFAGSLDGFVNVWDLTTERELASVRAHQASVFSLVFTPEGTLVSAAVDGFRFWRTEAATPAP